MADKKKLQVVIDAQDNASKKFSNIGKNSKKMSKTMKTAGKAGKIALKGIAVGATAAAAAIAGAGVAIHKMAERGSMVDSLQSSFENLSSRAGIAAGVFENRLNKSFKGLISQTEQLRLANKGLNSELSPDQITGMADASVKLSKTLNMSVTEAYEKLWDAMKEGTMGPAADLGIIFDQDAAIRQYADSIGKTVDVLSEQEKIRGRQIALMEQIRQKTDKLGDTTLTYGDIVKKLKNRLTNLYDTASVAISKKMIIPLRVAAKLMESSMEVGADGMSDMDEAADSLSDGLMEIITSVALLPINMKKAKNQIAAVPLAIGQVFVEAWDITLSALETMIFGPLKLLGKGVEALVEKVSGKKIDLGIDNTPINLLKKSLKLKESINTMDDMQTELAKEKIELDEEAENVKEKISKVTKKVTEEYKKQTEELARQSTYRKLLKDMSDIEMPKVEAPETEAPGADLVDFGEDLYTDSLEKSKEAAEEAMKKMLEYQKMIKEAKDALASLAQSSLESYSAMAQHIQPVRDAFNNFNTLIEEGKAGLMDYANFAGAMFGQLTQTVSSLYEAKKAKSDSAYEKEKENIMATIDDQEKREAALAKLDAKHQKEQRKIHEQQKKWQLAQAYVSAGLAITNAMTQVPWPLNLVAAALTAAEAYAQISMIKAQNFAQGGLVTGPGTGTSDDIPAYLSNGEYVVNAKATAQNRQLLEEINRGGTPRGSGQTVVNVQIMQPQIINSAEYVEEDLVPLINNAVNKGLTLKASEVS